MFSTRPSPLPRLLLGVLLLGFLLTPADSRAETQYGELALRVTGMLEEEHFLREPFNDKMSKRVLDTYLDMLDPSRIYFTAEDVEKFRKNHETTIDDKVREKDIQAAYDIYSIYEERVRSRVDKVRELAKPNTFTYDSSRTVKISREEADWASAGEEHDQLWRNLIEGDLIREKLIADALDEERQKEDAKSGDQEKGADEGKDSSGDGEADTGNPGSDSESGKTDAKPDVPGSGADDASDDAPQTAESGESDESIYDKVSERYERILDRVNDNETEDVATLFIKAIARAYDPHSEYFSQQQYDNFRIGMNKSLTGIGAMLQKDQDQGGATIEGLVVGGPAYKGGDLEVKDRVIGVAQGSEGEFTDVVEMKLSDIVDLIRGEIGTTVRLKVVPVGETDKIKLVDIVRDKIDLKDSLATADLIITKDPEGKEQKLGWITLPSFYADMDGGQTSTTKDVRRLLTRLSIENIDGLVVDLRDNGGGSLEEAINMTGLFIKRGPVVQSVDWRGKREKKSSRNGEAVYSGPLAVLTNRASASASEIFAAALQDYGRAVVVGNKSTFGKGTVQQLRPVLTSRLVLPFNRETNRQGALKLTIQTFFRINGDSTQRDGVTPDIRLPSMLNIADIGEDSLPNALDVDPIPPCDYDEFFSKPLPIEQLQRASEARVASGPMFEHILTNISEERKRIEENSLSLNLEKRKIEAEKAEDKRETRKKKRRKLFDEIRKEEKGLFTVYKLTQDNVLDEGLTLSKNLSEEELSGMTRGDRGDEEGESNQLTYPHEMDPYQRETLRVLQDLIAIRNGGSPVNFSEAKPSPREDTVPIEAKADSPN